MTQPKPPITTQGRIRPHGADGTERAVWRPAGAFVRFEPLVVPRRSLTGDSTERVDTRVLRVIYAFDPKQMAAFPGQQMDLFIGL